MQKGKNNYTGYFAILRHFLDPITFTKVIREIQMSQEMYDQFIAYCNLISNTVFSNVTHFYGIPIIVNDSFEPSRMELHLADRIELITLNL